MIKSYKAKIIAVLLLFFQTNSLSAQIDRSEFRDVHDAFHSLLDEVPSTHFYSRSSFLQLLRRYSDEELERVWEDLHFLRQKIFEEASLERIYIVTAGGPGVGKSTLLESFLEEGDWRDLHYPAIRFAYIDPDRSCLLHMPTTYCADRRSGIRDAESAYEYWRDASNFLSNFFLAIALRDGYAIAHGSTMASPYAKHALRAIRENRYQTVVLHISCDEIVRLESEFQRRKAGIVQCTAKDFIEKLKLFYSLVGDYLQTSNRVLFFYRQTLEEVRYAGRCEEGELTICDSEAFDAIRRAHDIALCQEGFWDSAFGI